MKNKVLRILAVLTLGLMMAMLTGCKRSQYIENHAYALIMGVDKTDGGAYEVTVRIPKISSGGGEGSEGGAASDYLAYSALGSDFNDALMTLNSGVPRDLNLSVLVLAVISDEIAETDAMNKVILQMAGNARIYGSARIAVCEGDAGDFVKKQEAVIGARLSEGLSAQLQNSAEMGYIVDSRLSDIFFATASVYSDPMAILCAAPENDGAMHSGDTSAQGLAVMAESKNRYMGAAVMKDGKVVGKLTGMQTVFVNLLRGSIDGFSYSMDGSSIQLAVLRKPSISIDTRGGEPLIGISLKLSAMGTPELDNVEKLTNELTYAISDTIAACQEMGAEPFGFAKLAAADFFTIDSWRSYNWRKAFSEAEIDLKIDVTVME